MNLWFVLAINSITLGGLLFLLSAGFSLIFGLMKIPNLTHGSFFMLGAYLATSLLARGFDFWTAAVAAGLLVAALGGVVERLILRRLPGAELAQVLVTLGLAFLIAYACLLVCTGDPIQVATPGPARAAPSARWPACPSSPPATPAVLGSLVGSFIVGFLYNFGQAMFPELAYVVLFLPMLIVLVVRPQGLFGRPAL